MTSNESTVTAVGNGSREVNTLLALWPVGYAAGFGKEPLQIPAHVLEPGFTDRTPPRLLTPQAEVNPLPIQELPAKVSIRNRDTPGDAPTLAMVNDYTTRSK